MDLFSPLALGDLKLSNRLVMAPLTRSRSGKDGVPNADVVEYYRQRASLGLIVSEGTYPSFAGQGFVRQPGLVTEEQIAGWKKVTDAVHAEGGLIVTRKPPVSTTSKHPVPSRLRASRAPTPESTPTRFRMHWVLKNSHGSSRNS